MKHILALTLTIGLLGSAAVSAGEPGRKSAIAQRLAAVPVAELPATAAELVRSARSSERAAVTCEVIREALARSPRAGCPIVAAVAKAVPKAAPVAAVTAALDQPRSAAELAQAAAAAAPSQAGNIVEAVCRAVKHDYRRIALAVASVVPNGGKEILGGVAAALPELEPGISAGLKQYGDNPSVALMLDSVKPAPASGALASVPNNADLPRALPTSPTPLGHGPLVVPPYVPLSGTVTNVSPSTSGVVPRGGRDYAAP